MTESLESQLLWIERAATASEKDNRAKIVGWQLIASTINSLVRSYNDLESASRTSTAPGSEDPDFRQIAIKKILVGQLHELHDALVAFEAYLTSNGLQEEELTKRRRMFARRIAAAQSLTTIRNTIAFHLAQLNLAPEELVRAYRLLDDFSISDLRDLLKEGILIGQSMKARLV